MTYDRHTKRAIREEAKRRNLPYQAVLQERWRPADEEALTKRLFAAARDVVGCWDDCREHLPANFVDDLIPELVRMVLPARKSAAPAGAYRARRPEPPEAEVVHWTISMCARRIVLALQLPDGFLDGGLRHIEELVAALAPVLVRLHPGHEASRDAENLRTIVALEYFDYPEIEHSSDSD